MRSYCKPRHRGAENWGERYIGAMPHDQTDYEGNPVEIPWPYLTQKAAAKSLGVPVEMLIGLANNPIPAVKTAGKSGGTVWLFQRKAVAELSRTVRS